MTKVGWRKLTEDPSQRMAASPIHSISGDFQVFQLKLSYQLTFTVKRCPGRLFASALRSVLIMPPLSCLSSCNLPPRRFFMGPHSFMRQLIYGCIKDGCFLFDQSGLIWIKKWVPGGRRSCNMDGSPAALSDHLLPCSYLEGLDRFLLLGNGGSII